MPLTVDTAKWDLAGVHGVRRWMWQILQAELGWQTSDYGGLVPITTPAQQPQLNDYSGPYIVYNYAEQSAGEDYFIKEEQAAFAIYSANEEDIRRVLNILVAYFGRYDDSAADLNRFLATQYNAFYKNFDYKNIRVLSTSGANAPTQEGGRQDGLIILRYRYTYDAIGVEGITRPGRERIDQGV